MVILSTPEVSVSVPSNGGQHILLSGMPNLLSEAKASNAQSAAKFRQNTPQTSENPQMDVLNWGIRSPGSKAHKP